MWLMRSREVDRAYGTSERAKRDRKKDVTGEEGALFQRESHIRVREGREHFSTNCVPCKTYFRTNVEVARKPFIDVPTYAQLHNLSGINLALKKL